MPSRRSLTFLDKPWTVEEVEPKMIEQTIPKKLLNLAETQLRHEENLLALPNVVGVAVGNKIKKGEDTGKPGLAVLVTQKVDAALLGDDEKVKSKIDETPTDVVEVGQIFAGGGPAPAAEVADDGAATAEDIDLSAGHRGFSRSLTRRVRPAQGGYSVGHWKITAGTIGTCCYDMQPFPGIPPKYYILSNNHVLANSNDARIGDPILQPGPADGGRFPRDLIARLSRWVPIRFISGDAAPCNFVDAAIAEGNFADLNREVYWIGHVRKLYTAPGVDDLVQKTGRTTGFTTGKVTHVNATVNVNYGGGRVARFCRQIITTNMSAPGDSGSLVTNLDEEAVGLLFAGSASHTIVNNIAYVQGLLQVRLTEK